MARKHLGVVGADIAPRVPHPARRTREARSHVLHAHEAEIAVRDRDDVLAGLIVSVGHNVPDVVDRPCDHVCAVEQLHDIG